jgi:transposase
MGRRRITVADIKEVLVAWDAGESVSAIARMFGYTRPTMRKYVRAAEHVGVARGGDQRGEAEWERLTRAVLERVERRRARGPAASAVATYRDYLEERIGTMPLSVLHQRLRDEAGLRASWRTFHRYVRAQWPERLRSAPQATVRLADPAPGEEAQVDFFYVGLWDDPAAGRRRKLYAFLMTLGHSRHQFLYPVLAEDAAAWHEGHSKALAFFGGVPRRVVPDNLSAGIRKADRYDPRVNRAYGEVARYYGFVVDPARAGQPTDKPKVERGVPYARASFFAGRDFASLEHMRAEAVQWCLSTAGLRTHGTTGEQPLRVFRGREQAALRPLPAQPWEPVSWTTAKVQTDCHLRAAGALYSAPSRYVGQRLDVRVGARTITIYDGERVVTTHVRQERGRATRVEHYPAAGQAFLRGTPRACLEQAQMVGEATVRLVQGLVEPPTLTGLRQVQAVLRLRERYDDARLERACQRALEAGDGRYRTVQGILERGLEGLVPEEVPVPAVTGAFLRGPAAFGRTGAEVAV